MRKKLFFRRVRPWY